MEERLRFVAELLEGETINEFVASSASLPKLTSASRQGGRRRHLDRVLIVHRRMMSSQMC